MCTDSGIWPRDDPCGYIYYGERDFGSLKPHGFGRAFYSNMSSSAGKWEHGYLSGHATFRYDKGIGPMHEVFMGVE